MVIKRKDVPVFDVGVDVFSPKKPKYFYQFFMLHFNVCYWRMHEMNDVIKTFGNNAGKIWKALEEEGPQVRTKLLDKTNLTEDEFYGAVGWLARENKIRKEKRTYMLGETNLTEKIGGDAGKVWSVLGTRTDIDVSAISRLSKIKKSDCYSALGWLAREGKITAKITVRKK